MVLIKNLMVRATARDDPSDVIVYDEVYDIGHYYERNAVYGDTMSLRLLRYRGENVPPDRVYIDLCKYNVDIHTILEE